MVESPPKRKSPPPSFLCKLVSKAPFQMPRCPPIVETILREKLGILSPKEIYIPGPEHDNCTLQTDKYYTQGKQGSKEKDGKKPEKDGHGARDHCQGGECDSHGHGPPMQGHSTSANPVGSPLMRSDEHGCLKNSHPHCCKSGTPSHHSQKKSWKSIDVIYMNAAVYRLQLIIILRQGILPNLRMLISVRCMIRSVQRDIFKKIRICMTAMERVPQLTLLRNVQNATNVVRRDPTHMIFTTKTHGIVLRVIAQPRILQITGVRQGPH